MVSLRKMQTEIMSGLSEVKVKTQIYNRALVAFCILYKCMLYICCWLLQDLATRIWNNKVFTVSLTDEANDEPDHQGRLFGYQCWGM